MTTSQTQLEFLMGAYLHEDYDIYGGLWEAVDRYLAETSDEDRTQLSHELEAALDGASEADVERLLNEMYCAVYMGDEPGGYKGWLEEISRRVSATL